MTLSFHPLELCVNLKPFGMGAHLSLIKPPIFLFDHWMFESRKGKHFLKKFDRFLAVEASKLVIFLLKKLTNFETPTA